MARSPDAPWGSRKALLAGIGNKCPQERRGAYILFKFWDFAQSTFSDPGGNALVSFHVTMSTWEAPSLLAPSHSKEAPLGNLIFLTTDAGVQSRCLRHVFSVCTALAWTGKGSRRGWERVLGPSPPLPGSLLLFVFSYRPAWQ